LAAITNIRELFINNQSNQENGPYFRSEAAKLIYYLVELSGETQQQKLGIDKSLYRRKEKAKEWRNKISMLIVSDKCSHLFATQANKQLNYLYARMIKYAK